MIGVIDYDAGNLTSVASALKSIGGDFFISKNIEELKQADKIIFPGVGEAKAAMKVLKERGLDLFLKDFARTGKPLFGICLGSQILFDHSQESDVPCLGLLPGKVRAFTPQKGYKVPHMGWNTLKMSNHPLFKGIPQESSFYFVHSYYIDPKKASDQIGTCSYMIDFCAAVARDNIMATQFHPEKSGPWGLKLLENFARGV